MDTNRFTQKSLEALQGAQQLAQSYGNAQVEQVHLLDSLLSQENGLIGQLMGKLGLNLQQVQTRFVKVLLTDCRKSREAISSRM